MPSQAESKELTLVAPDTGEVLTFNPAKAHAPEPADTREAVDLGAIVGAFMVAGVQYGVGKSFEGEYAVLLLVDANKVAKVVKTASAEVIATLRRMEVRYGQCSPQNPFGPMAFDKAKTSNGFTVHKLRMPAEADAKALLAALG